MLDGSEECAHSTHLRKARFACCVLLNAVIVAGYMTCLAYNTGNLAISWHALLCTLGVSEMSLPLHGLLMWHFFLNLVSIADDSIDPRVLQSKSMVKAIYKTNTTNIALGVTINWVVSCYNWNDH